MKPDTSTEAPEAVWVIPEPEVDYGPDGWGLGLIAAYNWSEEGPWATDPELFPSNSPKTKYIREDVALAMLAEAKAEGMREAMQLIADLPYPYSPQTAAGHEEAYRAVEAAIPEAKT